MQVLADGSIHSDIIITPNDVVFDLTLATAPPPHKGFTTEVGENYYVQDPATGMLRTATKEEAEDYVASEEMYENYGGEQGYKDFVNNTDEGDEWEPINLDLWMQDGKPVNYQDPACGY